MKKRYEEENSNLVGQEAQLGIMGVEYKKYLVINGTFYFSKKA